VQLETTNQSSEVPFAQGALSEENREYLLALSERHVIGGGELQPLAIFLLAHVTTSKMRPSPVRTIDGQRITSAASPPLPAFIGQLCQPAKAPSQQFSTNSSPSGPFNMEASFLSQTLCPFLTPSPAARVMRIRELWQSQSHCSHQETWLASITTLSELYCFMLQASYTLSMLVVPPCQQGLLSGMQWLLSS
jgi:hypothetical protein